MGILNNIFGNKKQKESVTKQEVKRQDYCRKTETEQGRRVFEYYDANAKFGQFYDTTRVIIDKEPIIAENTELYDCMVSWFNRDDVVMFDRDGNEVGSRTAYKHVVAGIDPNLMESNPEYLSAVIKKLLEKERVERYESYSLKSEAEILKEREAGDDRIVACGKYVGSVINSNGKWRNVFIGDIGRMFHSSPEMQEERRTHKERMEEIRKEKIEQKKAEIARLQAEVGEYEEQEEK